MPRYLVPMHATVTMTVPVEADTEDQAREIAYAEAGSHWVSRPVAWVPEFQIDDDEAMPDGTVLKAVALAD